MSIEVFEPAVIAPTPATAAVVPPIISKYFADLDAAALADVLEELDQATRIAFDRRDAVNTTRAYDFAEQQYQGFCETTRLPVFDTGSVARYLMWLVIRHDDHGSPTGVKYGTITNRLAGINRFFADNNYPKPGDNHELKLVLRGMKRILSRAGRVAPRKVAALLLDDLRSCVATCEAAPVTNLRDTALLTLCRYDLTPAVLAGLDWAAYRPTSRAAIWRLADGDLVLPGRPGDPDLCAVTALGRWAAALGYPMNGPVFSRLDQDGRSTGRPASRQALVWSAHRWLASVGAADPSTQVVPAFGDAVLRRAVAALAQPRLIDGRDRSLLLLGWRTATRRSNIADLRWGDLTVEDGGLAVRLRWTKSTQYEERIIGVERTGRATCPVAATLGWATRLQAALGREPFPDEPVFPRIDRHGRLLITSGRVQALTGGGVAEIVQTRAVRAGLVGDFNGHSLRRGFITEAVRSGTISLQVIRETTLHASLDSMLGYVAEARRFDNKIGVSLGL